MFPAVWVARLCRRLLLESVCATLSASVSLSWTSVKENKTWMSVGYRLMGSSSSLPDGGASAMGGDEAYACSTSSLHFES
eukprot:2664835-Amphidinium_carterae.3